MYGTLTAADDFQQGFTAVLEEELGFAKGVSAPTCLCVMEPHIDLAYHGDDIAILALKQDVDRVIARLQEFFDLSVKAILGFEPGDDKQAKLLNRILTVQDQELIVEADPRHAELIVANLGLSKCRVVNSPGVKLDPTVLENSALLKPVQATAYRGVAARARFLSEDRWDIGFAAKELCKGMASPSEANLMQAKRLGRYLKGRMRVVRVFRKQRKPRKLVVHGDSDHIGDVKTRKGSCGYIIYHGVNTIKAGCSTHALPALSSAEDEFFGVCKAGSEGLGIQSGCSDFGDKFELEVLTDSSAARAISRRQGIGRIRHLAVRLLWVQHYVKAGLLNVDKILGSKNSSDMLTKHLARTLLDTHAKTSGLRDVAGRSPIAPKVQGDLQELSHSSVLLLCRL